jgi:hypothetical protein
VFQEDNYEQYPHANCGHGKEIDGYHLADMVVEEVRHIWLGGRRSLRRMRDTVRSEMAMPSIFSSP